MLALAAVSALAALLTPLDAPPVINVPVYSLATLNAGGRAAPPRCSAAISDAYDLDSRELELPEIDDGGGRNAYLTEEVPREGAERARRAIVLLPGEGGFACERTRKLADRLAVFCFSLVLVPDLGGPWPEGQSPPQRAIDADVRAAAVFLRADHGVGPIALSGIGLGGSLVLRAVAADGQRSAGAVGGVALCPPRPRRDELDGLLAQSSTPLLVLTGDEAVAEEYSAGLGLAGADDPPPGAAPLRTVRRFAGLQADADADEDEDEDGLFFLESWVNFELDRAAAARARKD